MNDHLEELNPQVAAWFADTATELNAAPFTDVLLQRLAQSQRAQRARQVMIYVLVLVLMCGLGALSGEWLVASLLPLSSPWLHLIFAPVNSLAGVLAMTMLCGWALLRCVRPMA